MTTTKKYIYSGAINVLSKKHIVINLNQWGLNNAINEQKIKHVKLIIDELLANIIDYYTQKKLTHAPIKMHINKKNSYTALQFTNIIYTTDSFNFINYIKHINKLDNVSLQTILENTLQNATNENNNANIGLLMILLKTNSKHYFKLKYTSNKTNTISIYYRLYNN